VPDQIEPLHEPAALVAGRALAGVSVCSQQAQNGLLVGRQRRHCVEGCQIFGLAEEGGAMALTTMTGPVISAGQSLSDAIDCSAVDKIIRIIVPSAWNGAPMSFQLSSDGADSSPKCNSAA
jgi:hypothetical protein